MCKLEVHELHRSPKKQCQASHTNFFSSPEPEEITKIVSSRTNGPISTKLGTKHPWVKGSQVCSNKGPLPFPRGENNEILKIH